MKVSLCFITCNLHEHVQECYAGLCQYAEYNEILVLKNGCNPDYISVEDNIKVISTAQCIGIAAARNLCIQNCNSDFIIWMDDDICPLGPFVDAFIQPFINDATIGIVGYDGHISSDDDDWWNYSVIGTTPDYFDSPYAIRLQMIKDIGSYDEAFSVMGGDNSDLCLRAYTNSWQLHNIEAPQIAHWVESSRSTLIELMSQEEREKEWSKTLERLRQKFPRGYRNNYPLPPVRDENIQHKYGFQRKIDIRYLSQFTKHQLELVGKI